MKFFAKIAALLLLCGSAGSAWAYRINVLDPPTPPDDYTVHGINSPTAIITVDFAICATGQLPPGTQAAPGTVGCFSLQNNTRATLNSLLVVFPNTGDFASSTPDCSPDTTIGVPLYNSFNCTASNGVVNLFFSGGGPAPGVQFVITISDIDPYLIDGLPSGTAAVDVASPVPEPGSLALLSTGLASVGAATWRRRRWFASRIN